MNLEQIDTSTTAGKAEVMRLAAEGRRVAKKAFNDTGWIDCPEPSWNWPEVEYAIYCEPVGPDEVWATVIDGNMVVDAYSTEQEADAALNRDWQKVKYIRADLVRELA